MPLFFYSKKCPHSRRLEATLRSTPGVDKAIRFVCVDGQIDRIPSEIHSVPALLVPTSEGNKVVFETQMYEWLNSTLRLEQKRQQQQQQQQPPRDNRYPPGYNQHVMMRPPVVQNNNRGSGSSAPPPQYKSQDQNQNRPDQYLAPRQQIGPDAFVTTSDASLCDVNLEGDFAGHLFAGAEEEIRIPFVDDSGAASSSSTPSGPRQSQTTMRQDNDVISQVMAARNQELSSVYSNTPKPIDRI
nr:hypothetical protein TetV2_00257 [Oceanusvirus sp.]